MGFSLSCWEEVLVIVWYMLLLSIEVNYLLKMFQFRLNNIGKELISLCGYDVDKFFKLQ